LGSRSNVEEFFEKNGQELLAEFLDINRTPPTEKELKHMDVLSQTIRKIQEVEVETAVLESQLIELQHEKRYYGLVTDTSSDLKVSLSVISLFVMDITLTGSQNFLVL
jgi:hypothetical protein